MSNATCTALCTAVQQLISAHCTVPELSVPLTLHSAQPPTFAPVPTVSRPGKASLAQAAVMPSTTSQIKMAAWAFIALAMVGWILCLIGLAGTQAECYKQGAVDPAGDRPVGSGLTGATSTLLSAGIRGLNWSYGCERRYSYYWFTLALEFVTLAGLTVMTFMGLLAASALSWMAWLTVLSLLTIQSSDTFLALRSGTTGSHFSLSALTAAGWIIMAIANLALIFLLAWRPRKNTGNSASGPIKY